MAGSAIIISSRAVSHCCGLRDVELNGKFVSTADFPVDVDSVKVDISFLCYK